MQSKQESDMCIQKKLLSVQDLKYKDFHKKLMPTIPENRIIGIRIPLLRKYAKEILNSIGMAQAMTDRDRAKISL